MQIALSHLPAIALSSSIPSMSKLLPRDVKFHRTGVTRLRHPLVGELNLPYEAMELSADGAINYFNDAALRLAQSLGQSPEPRP